MVRFDAYMDRCLYGSDGFYTGSGEAGRRGDFLTSPEVGPLFGAVLTRAIAQWWNEAGRPEPFTVYDVGCGPGTLLRTIQRAARGMPWHLVGIDRAPDPSRVENLAGVNIELRTHLPPQLGPSVVVANELLDNLPVRILVVGETDQAWGEVFVETEHGSAPIEIVEPADPTDPAVKRCQALVSAVTEALPVGTRVPCFDAAHRWIADTVAAGPLRICLFDYGGASTVELSQRGGWLRTYRQHERGHDPYLDPGRWDITCDVAFDQLPAPAWIGRQYQFLDRWGIDDLVQEGRDYWLANAQAPDLTAMMMRSRDTEAPALLERDGLGGWMVGLWEPPHRE